MNNNNFLKAMSMIDEDLIKEADTINPEKTVPDISADPSGSNEHSEVVSGVDVIHTSLLGKILAVAAAVILVTSIAGGGVYYYSKIRNNDNNNVEDEVVEEEIDIAKVFEEIFENRESYNMSHSRQYEIGDGFYYEELNDPAKEDVFQLLDKFIVYSEIEKTDEPVTDDSVQFLISKKETEKSENYLYKIEMYSNSVFEFSVHKQDDSEKTYRYKLSQEDLFEYLMHINNYTFINNNTDDNYETYSPEFASTEEIEELLNNIYESGNDKCIFHYYEKEYNCIIKNKDNLIQGLQSFEWEKRKYDNISDAPLLDDNYFDIGIRIDLNFNIYDTKQGSPYTLFRAYSGYRELEDILRENIEIEYDSQDVSEQVITDLLGEGRSAAISKGHISNYLTYNITDLESLKNEIASLGWVTSIAFEDDFGPTLSDSIARWNEKPGYFIGDARISPGGYIHDANYNDFYKLKNRDDSQKLQQILDKYLEPDKCTDICLKLQNGLKSYNNMKAHYIYESTSDEEFFNLSFSGEILKDVNKKLMYMTGEGKYYDYGLVNIELVDNLANNEFGHFYGIIKVTEKDTGEIRYIEDYFNGGNCLSQPGIQYDVLVYDIISSIRGLSESEPPVPRYVYQPNLLSFNITTKGYNTEYYIHTQDLSEDDSFENEYWIQIDDYGRLISYKTVYQGERKGSVLFRLDDYEFDSSDFTMEGHESAYDELMKEKEKLDIKKNN